jgi:alkanesulfonate monooxygenase SsuD/methylene tetrahydromethanopterin reductase-like flavin-dependent oxidoreductase (luciferase family)
VLRRRASYAKAGVSAGIGVRIAAEEVWLHTFSLPHRTVATARAAEAAGHAGLLVADSQNLNADVWVELALAAAAI